MRRDKKKKGCIRGKRGEVWLFKKNQSDTIDKKPTNRSLYNQNIFCSSELYTGGMNCQGYFYVVQYEKTRYIC